MAAKRRRKGGKAKTTRKRRASSSDDLSDASVSSTEAGGKPQFKRMPMDRWTYNLDELLIKTEFNHPEFFFSVHPKDFNLDFIRRTGLEKPMLFNAPPVDLGMRMPNAKTFSVNTVEKLIGGKRNVEVVEVFSQGSQTMELEKFIRYYKSAEGKRRKLLNVLSLEFSRTPMAEKIKAPGLIKNLDWFELYWPKELRDESPIETSADPGTSLYPKVQNYCLMSVKGCYTDFHIDFGGTSVWYHVLKGSKVFWMIEPTEQNLTLYEHWVLSGPNQNATFFGDIVEKCGRVQLQEGNTFVIPSGWIHAVFTPVDSLVFGGNFLHSFAIPMQLRIFQCEERIKVHKKYRYPFYIQMLWYVVERVVKMATGRVHFHFKPPMVVVSQPSTSVESSTTTEQQETDQEKPVGQTSNIPKMEDVDEKPPLYDENQVYMSTGPMEMVPVLPSETIPQPEYQPVEQFNDDYLKSLTTYERDGFYCLLNYLLQQLSNRKREIVEGITDLQSLITDFQAVMTRCGKLEQANENKNEASIPEKSMDNMEKSMDNMEKSMDNMEPGPSSTPRPSSTLPSSKRKQTFPKHGIGSTGTKTVNRLPQASKRKSEPSALPQPEQSVSLAAPVNPHGFDPMQMLTALGHKPLPSAFRRTANMATVPVPLDLINRLKPKPADEAVGLQQREPLQLESSSSSDLSPRTPSQISPRTAYNFAVKQAHGFHSQTKPVSHRPPATEINASLEGDHHRAVDFERRSVIDRAPGQPCLSNLARRGHTTEEAAMGSVIGRTDDHRPRQADSRSSGVSGYFVPPSPNVTASSSQRDTSFMPPHFSLSSGRSPYPAHLPLQTIRYPPSDEGNWYTPHDSRQFLQQWQSAPGQLMTPGQLVTPGQLMPPPSSIPYSSSPAIQSRGPSAETSHHHPPPPPTTTTTTPRRLSEFKEQFPMPPPKLVSIPQHLPLCNPILPPIKPKMVQEEEPCIDGFTAIDELGVLTRELQGGQPLNSTPSSDNGQPLNSTPSSDNKDNTMEPMAGNLSGQSLLDELDSLTAQLNG